MNWSLVDLLLVFCVIVLAFVYVRRDLKSRSPSQRAAAWFFLLCSPVLFGILRLQVWTTGVHSIGSEWLQLASKDVGANPGVVMALKSQVDALSKTTDALAFMTWVLLGLVFCILAALRIASSEDARARRDPRSLAGENLA